MTKKIILRISKIICVLAVILLLIFISMNLFSRCLKWLDTGDIKIKEMNNELKAMLSNRYMLYIGDDIIFVEGYYDQAFQDNSIHLTLKVPESNITEFYNNFYYLEEETYIDREVYKRMSYIGELHTYMDFYASDDEYMLVKFIGRYPGSRPGVERSN